MSESGNEALGDNIEFTASAIGDYTLWLATDGTDTEFAKFTENPRAATKFTIRTDKNTDIVSIDETEFTDPIQITADKAHTETRTVARITRIKIRTTDTDTMIKLRWF